MHADPSCPESLAMSGCGNERVGIVQFITRLFANLSVGGND